MANWSLIPLLALAGIGILLLLYRGDNVSPRSDDRQGRPRLQPDYPPQEEREDARLAHMSAEDRAWETASLQRHDANPERDRVLAASRL